MRLKSPIAASTTSWLGKGFVRFLLLMVAAAAVAAFAASFGIAHDYSYLHASILTGSHGGQYYALAKRLADRAEREHGALRVTPTAGSIENARRLSTGRGHCAEMFALGRTRDCRSILPVAGESHVAGILGIPFMAVTVLFNGLKVFSRYRFWRIDAAREKLETALKGLVDPKLTHAQIRELSAEEVTAGSQKRAAAQAIMDRLLELRAHCQRQTNSLVTPMGDEMFYRYQQGLIDEATTTVGALLHRSPSPTTQPFSKP